jgi:uncharacterized membrane protein SpoIIM required for sporulation
MFWLSAMIMGGGVVFGGFSVFIDQEAKEALMPFAHLQESPGERIAREETGKGKHLSGKKTTFSSQLMTHNTKVSILVMGLGITFGIGTLLVLFTNGIMLGAVMLDYIIAGKTKFLAGWLLPHGVIEIPAVIIAGQAGLILAFAMTGRNSKAPLKKRLKTVSGDVVVIIWGVFVLLVWAGIVEAFMSQYHEPVLPYELKIGFGLLEFMVLVLFLLKAGRKKPVVPDEYK